MRSRSSHLLYCNRDANGSILDDLHQWIGHVSIGDKCSRSQRAGRVHRIGGCGIHFFDMILGTSNRDAGGIRLVLHNLFPVEKSSRNARMYLNLASETRVKVQVQLAGTI